MSARYAVVSQSIGGCGLMLMPMLVRMPIMLMPNRQMKWTAWPGGLDEEQEQEPGRLAGLACLR